MFPTIHPVKRLRFERSEDFETPAVTAPAAAQPTGSIATILRAFGSSIDDDLPRSTMREPNTDWSALIDRIRSTASRIREVEAQSRERETHVEELLERARADMRMAEERVRAAEAQASDLQVAAMERVRAAEERAAQAEERARISEAWLKQIHETIFNEFTVLDEAPR